MISIRLLDPVREIASILALWRRSIGPAFPLDERLFQQQMRLEKSPALLLGVLYGTGENAFVGMIQAKRASRPGPDGSVPASGNIAFVAVDPDFRRQGLGSLLLWRAEAWLSREGASSVRFGADTWHFFPGIPESAASETGSEAMSDNAFAEARAFALARGFEPGKLEHDVAADLALVDPFGPVGPAGLAGPVGAGPATCAGAGLAPGYRTTIFDAGRRGEVDAFFARCFPGRWWHDVAEMLDTGMRPEDLLLLEETASGRIAGFALVFNAASAIYGPGLYWRELMGEAPGGLGPIGVDESIRGKGLGLCLLAAGLAELKSRGCRFTVIDWTDLVGFYAKFGFCIWKSYRMYSKQLAPRRTPASVADTNQGRTA